MKKYMTDLPKGARFIGPDGSEYKVTTPAGDHPRGWVDVWNLSMTDAEVERRRSIPGFVEPGTHPREGSFSYSSPTEVEVLG